MKLAMFLPAALAVLVIPGPAVAYIITRSLHQGRRAGLVSVLGLTTGLVLQVAAAVAGLSALLLSSAIAFRIVKLAGAAYLIYLGVRTLMTKARPVTGPAPARTTRRLYFEGVLINSLNPKPALFLAAFLPQFIDGAAPATPQLMILGLMFCGLALLSDGAYALLAGTVAARFRSRRSATKQGRAARAVAGSSYIGLGIAAAVSGERPA